WQRIDAALTAAEGLPPGPPAQRVPRWDRVRTNLARVCPPGSALDPAAEPTALAAEWEGAADPAAAETVFLNLVTAARHEFKHIDDLLLDLADQLTDIIEPLNTLLEVI
ncbi:hypothetical protein R5W23_003869, partial [Gemmata sp. JC673]